MNQQSERREQKNSMTHVVAPTPLHLHILLALPAWSGWCQQTHLTPKQCCRLLADPHTGMVREAGMLVQTLDFSTVCNPHKIGVILL